MNHQDSKLSHIKENGDARMVDISDKHNTRREALACAFIKMQPSTLELILNGDTPKGDVLATARIAGIMAAKKTHELIPMCHPLLISTVELDLTLQPENSGIYIEARCGLKGKTGIEMEALTAATTAALTIYDMCKAVDRFMEISTVKLLEKKGGKSGHWINPEAPHQKT